MYAVGCISVATLTQFLVCGRSFPGKRKEQTIADTGKVRCMLLHADNDDDFFANRNTSPPTKRFSTYEWLRQEARKKDEEIEQRFRPSLPKSLPPEMDRQVDALLAKKGVTSKIAREQVCDKDLSRLLPCQWLNDELINFYGAMILERSEACKENSAENGRKKPLNIHYFNTFFWSKLQGEGYERARLAKWTKKV